MYLQNWSQSGTALLFKSSLVACGGESTKVLTLLFDDAAEMQRLNRGQVSFNRLEKFAVARYGKDVTLGLWAARTLLRDAIFFKLHPNDGKVGRNYELVVRHILTGQTREEWIDAGGSVDRLHCPLLWVIDIDSLKSQYHKLYMHGDNYCTDSHNHWRYRSDQGYSSDMRLLDAKELEDQARVQGLTPCIYAVIHEWVITWL